MTVHRSARTHGPRWGHDLRTLHGKLTDGAKAKIEATYEALGSPYREWKGPDGVEAILRRERRGFVSWRYLAEGHDGSLTSNPFDDTETIAAHCESCSPW